MPKRKSRLKKSKKRSKRRMKKWDFVSPVGAGIGASAKLSAIGKTPALLPALGAGF